MKAEIISVGTELLLGQTVNTNAAFIAQELHCLGIDSYFQSTVGDNEKRIHDVLNIALNRADILITTGGLGPTPDDLTHEAIASFFQEKTILDKRVLKSIELKFKMRKHKKMPPMNKKQAYKISSAKWINNKLGTANGIIWKVKRFQNKIIITFPGVPSEMKTMWREEVFPYLKSHICKDVIYSQTLRYTGIGESALSEKIKKYFNQKDPTVAPYADIGDVKIRITSKAKNLKIARKNVEHTSRRIVSKTKKYLFSDKDETLEEVVSKRLKKLNLTLSCAESCTGGFLAKTFTDLPGSSKFFNLSVVSYSNKSKVRVLNICPSVLAKYGAVSTQVARDMADSVRVLGDSDISIAITGVAGPSGGTKEKPVGLVCFGLSTKTNTITEKKYFGEKLSRHVIRKLSVQYALNMLRLLLNK